MFACIIFTAFPIILVWYCPIFHAREEAAENHTQAVQKACMRMHALYNCQGQNIRQPKVIAKGCTPNSFAKLSLMTARPQIGLKSCRWF